MQQYLGVVNYKLASLFLFFLDAKNVALQAHGLCFSVCKGIRPPPSLVNIFKVSFESAIVRSAAIEFFMDNFKNFLADFTESCSSLCHGFIVQLFRVCTELFLTHGIH